MSEKQTMTGNASGKQNDTLLWLAGALVAGVGGTWLLISSPWFSSSSDPSGAESSAASAAAASPASSMSAARSAAGTDSIEGADGASAARTAVGTDGASAAANATAAASDLGVGTGAAGSGATAQSAAPAPATAASHSGAYAEVEASLDQNPLRMAALALEAGMLVEPEEYSAWSLYRRALEQTPNSTEAKQGLEKISEELIRRANAAIEQGRFDDARKTVDRIREALPDHAGAQALAARLEELTPKKVVAASSARTSAQSEDKVAERRETKPKTTETEPAPAPKIDPVVEARDAFAGAMLANRLLTPIDSSAKHFVNVLMAIAPNAPVTRDARKQLSDKFLARAEESLAARDTDAAKTWIDEAERLGIDASGVETQRQKLTDQLVEIESARRLPASEFKVVSYTAPVYPQRALERNMSGWVDVEFTVTRDGSTRDVVVTDASSDRYFRDEAIEAVEKWRFEPRVFMNRTIEQRAYSRIRFNIE